MNILVLAPGWPDPPRQGAAIRNLHLLLYLAGKHRVTLLTFEPDGPMSRERIKAACAHAEALPAPTRDTTARLRTLATSPLPDMAWRLHSEQMRERVIDLCSRERFDAVHIEGIEMAPYGLLAARLQSAALTYDAHNAEYLLQRRAFTTDAARLKALPKALYSLVQWWRLRTFERNLCLASRYVFAVSDADAAALARLSPRIAGRTIVLPNGVDVEYWSRDAQFGVPGISDTGEAVVFDGSMDFRPNVDAVVWFANEVWLLIRGRRPSAHFYIVGRNPAPQVAALASLPGITVTGAVEDTRPWVAGAAVYVVPMRMGGGVRLKVLQAMSMSCAIVSTPMGAEGVRVTPGEDILIAWGARPFADAVLGLLADSRRGVALGQTARRTAVEHYSWEKLLPRLDAVYPPGS